MHTQIQINMATNKKTRKVSGYKRTHQLMERLLLPQTGRSDRILHRLDVRHRWIVMNSAETNFPKLTQLFRAMNPLTIAANSLFFFIWNLRLNPSDWAGFAVATPGSHNECPRNKRNTNTATPKHIHVCGWSLWSYITLLWSTTGWTGGVRMSRRVRLWLLIHEGVVRRSLRNWAQAVVNPPKTLETKIWQAGQDAV